MSWITKFMEGAAAPGGAPVTDQGLQPQPFIDENDFIHIEDGEIPGLQEEPKRVAGEPGKEAPAADAGKAPEPRFASVNGQKIELDKDGNIPEEALTAALKGKFVPEPVFHREVQRAKAAAKGGESGRVTRETVKKELEPFVRKENPNKREDDPDAYWQHEREQDKAETAHERKVDAMQRDEFMQNIQRESLKSQHANLTRELNEQFAESAQRHGVLAGDTPARKAVRELLWHLVAEDPRHKDNQDFNGDGDPVDAHGNVMEIESLTTDELVQEGWQTMQRWLKHEIEALTTKASGSEGKLAAASPHSGGAVSIAAQPPKPGEDGKPKISPQKPGESVFNAILRDVRGGMKAQ